MEQGGLATAPGPLRCSGATVFGFWIPAHLESLRGLCDAVFASPSRDRVVVRPFLPWVLLTFVRIDEIVSEPEPFRSVGHVTEREVVIWVPTLAFQSPRLVPRRLRRWSLVPRHVPSAMVPCMWLDDPISIASGREVYGYPKSWGCIDSDPPEAIAADPGASVGRALPAPPRRLSLAAYGIEDYGHGESPRCRPLLELQRAEDSTARHEEGSGLDSFVSACSDELGHDVAAGWSMTAERRRAGIELSQLFLRQFRSPLGGGRASSQEIVRVPATDIEAFRWRRLPPYELTVGDLDSHPITEVVGDGEPGSLRLGIPERTPTKLPFVARFDFRVELGEILWRARGAGR